jgi:hypothetical protein
MGTFSFTARANRAARTRSRALSFPSPRPCGEGLSPRSAVTKVLMSLFYSDLAAFPRVFGGEGVGQLPLKDKAFLTFLGQNPPFELRRKLAFRLQSLQGIHRGSSKYRPNPSISVGGGQQGWLAFVLRRQGRTFDSSGAPAFLCSQRHMRRRTETPFPSHSCHCHAVSANNSRPISIRRISPVPAPISYSLASRHRRPVGYSLM